MNNYIPPFSITNKIINLISEISEKVANIVISEQMNSNPHLRRNNRLRTIQASLAIENNSLSLEQVTAIIGGKHIIGAAHEIKEVKNAYQMYEHLHEFNPYSIKNLMQAHKILMQELVAEAGEFRHKAVGIANNERIIHIAPPAENVQWLMKDLFQWLKDSKEHLLIKSCIFHYEFEFIHPFTDGNGRIGRFWQTLLLNSWKPVFAWLLRKINLSIIQH
ncbi:MAG: Fic family protein [Bacteroidales bacterium]|jgi:Fic family protein